MRRGLLALIAHIYLANHPRGRSPPGNERAYHARSPRNPNPSPSQDDQLIILIILVGAGTRKKAGQTDSDRCARWRFVAIVLMPCRRRKGQRGVEKLPPTASKRVRQTSLGSDNRHTRPFSPLPPLSCYASPKHADVPTWTGFARLRTWPIRLVARSRWRWQPVPLRFGSASQRIVQRTSAWLVTRSSQLHLARSRPKLRWR